MIGDKIKRFFRNYFFGFGITAFLFTLLSLIPIVDVERLVTVLYAYSVWSFLTLLISTLLFRPGLDLKELWIRRAVSIVFSALTFALIYYKIFFEADPFLFIIVVALYVVAVVAAYLIEDSYIRRKLKKINKVLEKGRGE